MFGSESDHKAGVKTRLYARGRSRRTGHLERVAVLLDQVIDLAHADTVLTSAGATHGERTVHQPAVQRLHFRELFRVVRIKDEVQMEVAVADVTDERRERLRRGQVLLGIENALGKR